MAEIKGKEASVRMIAYRKYSDTELADFDKKTKRFFSDYLASDGKTYRILDRVGLSCAFGATDKNGAVILDDFSVSPNRLEQLDNLLNQWSFWRGKEKWIENKKMEGLEKVAQNMTVDTSWEKELENF